MLEAIEGTLMQERPDGVIVYGDTNSTLAGALAAVKLHIPVAHIEAGLRSRNRAMPEEINRIVTDHVSTRLYCPTEVARRHLAAEGVVDGVEVVGDVMYDLLLQVRPLLAERARNLLPTLEVAPGAYILATIHRAENTDNPQRLRQMVQALGDLALPVVFPIHPRTRHAMGRRAIAPRGPPSGRSGRIPRLLTLERHAFRVITDSGGVQKEAFVLGAPV